MDSAFRIIWRHKAFPAVVIFGFAFMVRIIYLNLFPLMYWHDGYHRLAHAEQLVQSLWLPLYQTGIALLAPFTRDPGNFRLMTALQAAWAAAAGAWLLRRLGGPWAGWLAGLFLAVCPLFIYESLGLSQESLFNALLLTSACFLFRGSRGSIWLGLVFLAAACLTRYEAWLATPLVLGWIWLGLPGAAYRPTRPFAFRLSASLAVVAVPIGWMVTWHGLSPIGTSSLDIGLDWNRIGEYLRIWGKHQVQWGGVPLMLLAAYGLLDWVQMGFGALRAGSESAGFRQRCYRWLFSGKESILNGWILLFLVYAGLVFSMLVVTHPFHPLDQVRGAHVALLVEMVLGIRGWLVCHATLTRYTQEREQGNGRAKGVWWRRWEVGMVRVLALVAFIPSPNYMLRSLRLASDHPMARLSGEVHAELRDSDERIGGVLVLSEGFRSWPDAEPSACMAVTVGLRFPHERVLCDSQVPDAKLGSWTELQPWLLSKGITHVLLVNGDEPWRPIHLLFQKVQKSQDALPLAFRAETFELYRLDREPP